MGAISFISELTPIEKKGKNKICQVASPEKVPNYLKLSDVGATCAGFLCLLGHETEILT